MAEKDNAELLQQARDFKDVDLYELLSVEATATKENIHRAWRKTSLKYHPDKTGSAFDAEKYSLFEHARNVLVDPAARAAYDQARGAVLQRKQERERVEGKRRAMMDDLEAREREAREARVREEERANELEREKMRLREQYAREQEERERRHREMDASPELDELAEREAELTRQIEERKAQKRARRAEKKARKMGVSMDGSVPEPSTADDRPRESRKPASARHQPELTLEQRWKLLRALVRMEMDMDEQSRTESLVAEQIAAQQKAASEGREWSIPRPVPRFRTFPARKDPKPRIIAGE